MLNATGVSLLPLGRVARLQIQPARLTLSEPGGKRYDPAGLRLADELVLTPRGALIRTWDGQTVLDVHHQDHPQAYVDEGGVNALSLGFSRHYTLIRERFGPGLADGLAGENILVETSGRIYMDDLAGGLAIQSAGGLVWLQVHQPAAPCRPFSTYVLGRQDEPEALKSALQFLGGGMRGFYCGLAGPGPAGIAVGDQVFLPGK